MFTVVRYVRMSPRDDVAAMRRQMEQLVDEELNAVIMVNRKLLKEEHVAVWNKVSSCRACALFVTQASLQAVVSLRVSVCSQSSVVFCIFSCGILVSESAIH